MNKKGILNYPHGITAINNHGRNEIYVVDRDNHRVVCYVDGKYLSQFGTVRFSDKKFCYPYGITMGLLN